MHFFDRLNLAKAKVSTVAIALETIAEMYEIPGLEDCAKTLIDAKFDLLTLMEREDALTIPADPAQIKLPPLQ
jgi:hypothetical protein